MVKTSKVSALVLALALISATGLAQAAFAPSMTADQIQAEVAAQKAAGKSLKDIMKAAQAAGIDAKSVETAMIATGSSPDAVVKASASENKSDKGGNNNRSNSGSRDGGQDTRHGETFQAGGGAKEPVASPGKKK